ncbi:DNA polymerase III subunit delta [Nocardioides marmotae]|uniref:DNA polymerase III subunit delta n=1 Tax=Nocardioides marmotae TaxID=2663857 RepID=A0A6I3JG02_9ACTN|nr:DNA polymerase III subunit delta [Nocardioides marmotae]MCR6033598.1 DNA polymerase III subunit delta [Gordonia jinghuaiqii]MBC9735585.1 DNA polymerase III subunit delta [Nocardioides marmotae]MTB86681.1 DNA polymerase III subunit delta [Nocardioides marmotae]MTB97256.1 DNA polymerase III subunit delta [Nocardioides marmotae]QKE02170.1 DNA polymerase III subunit delta [Nocardioides marmotae]
MAAGPKTADVLGRVTLVTGKEEFLNERTVAAVRAAVRAHDAEAELSETAAGELSLATLGELSAPSLFSSTRCVVVRALENLPEESVAGLLAYAQAPVEDVALVLVHGGGPKGSGVLTKLRKAAGVTEVKSGEPKASEFPGFVAAEVRRYGSTIDQEAASFLVSAVGQDLRSLAAAAHQLTHDFPGQSLDVEKVKRYFGGRAEAKSFAVADAAFSGRRHVALEELRWALDGGTAPVLVTSAFAGGVRGLARYQGAPRGMREGDLAREIGVPPWKIRSIRDQSRGWTEQGLAQAIRAVAQADADIKGAASDASYTLERLVLTITALREGR